MAIYQNLYRRYKTMKNNIYTLFNGLTLRYEGTFESPTDASASVTLLRQMGKHPDYDKLELCRVASIDIETGLVTAEKVPIRIHKQEVLNCETPIQEIET